MLKKLKQINRPKTFNDDSILPLINIVFLLLIFFIVIGKFLPSEIKKTDLLRLTATNELNRDNIIIRITDISEVLIKGEPLKWQSIKFEKGQSITLAVDKNANGLRMVKVLNKLKKRGLKSVEIIVKPQKKSN